MFFKFNSKMNYALSLAAGMIFTACADYEFADEIAIKNISVKEEFTENFISRYGQIDPNHTWGFDDIEAVSLTSQTRSGENLPETYGKGFVDVNRNMWTQTDNNGYKSDALARVVKIPGWPNFDGKYYTVNSSGAYNSIETTQPTDMSTYQAAGDVTDYEIQWVSRWFREHQNPTSIQLHLTDFFVQNVSADNDRVSYPDGQLITSVFDENCDFSMDHIIFAGIESTPYATGIDDTWTHLNNYNSGNTNKMHNEADNIISDGWKTHSGWYCNTALHNREIKYVTSSGTEDFAYTESFGMGESRSNVGTYHNNWVLVHLDWNEVGFDGNTYHRDGYYLAFDYATQKVENGEEKTYGPDGYYSNWIVKITPAYDSEERNSPRRRVMCEDLGNTFDFDFNDVVFDIYYHGFYNQTTNKNQTDAVITIQASGGTLPIYVGKEPSIANGAYEAHHLLGNSSSTPVNVGGTKHEIAIYRIEDVNSTNPNDLPIYVQEHSNNATSNITLLPTTGKGDKYAPQKFMIPNTTTQWLKERQQIEWGYELFDSWVGNDTSFSEYYDANNNLINASITPWYSPTSTEVWQDGKKYNETVHEEFLY